jgi:hypothetical protein
MWNKFGKIMNIVNLFSSVLIIVFSIIMWNDISKVLNIVTIVASVIILFGFLFLLRAKLYRYHNSGRVVVNKHVVTKHNMSNINNNVQPCSSENNFDRIMTTLFIVGLLVVIVISLAIGYIVSNTIEGWLGTILALISFMAILGLGLRRNRIIRV